MTKRATPGAATAPPPPPPIDPPERFDEWNGFKRRDLVKVRGGHKGSVWMFLAFVRTHNGREYVEVIEQQQPNRRDSSGAPNPGPRLQRAFEPDRIMPMPAQTRKRLKAKADEKQRQKEDVA